MHREVVAEHQIDEQIFSLVDSLSSCAALAADEDLRPTSPESGVSSSLTLEEAQTDAITRDSSTRRHGAGDKDDELSRRQHVRTQPSSDASDPASPPVSKKTRRQSKSLSREPFIRASSAAFSKCPSFKLARKVSASVSRPNASTPTVNANSSESNPSSTKKKAKHTLQNRLEKHKAKSPETQPKRQRHKAVEQAVAHTYKKIDELNEDTEKNVASKQTCAAARFEDQDQPAKDFRNVACNPTLEPCAIQLEPYSKSGNMVAVQTVTTTTESVWITLLPALKRGATSNDDWETLTPRKRSATVGLTKGESIPKPYYSGGSRGTSKGSVAKVAETEAEPRHTRRQQNIWVLPETRASLVGHVLDLLSFPY
ncbi:hypothetical protein HDU80_005572 [Chytriomyces hyalinus]|nr:hypothetical protein HDU80_005572 [Chytriomyces hyalinus]